MWAKLFLDHPRTVGETYLQHCRAAFSFGIRMLLGGLACLVHAIVPCLFVKTASGMIRTLHDQMVVNRRRVAQGDASLSEAASATR